MRKPKRRTAAILLWPLMLFTGLPQAALAQELQEGGIERQVVAVTSQPANPVGAKLPGTVIAGHKNPLRQSDRRLSILIASLPSGGERAQKRMDIVGWMQNQVALRRDPNQASGEELQMMQRASAPPVGPDPDSGIDP